MTNKKEHKILRKTMSMVLAALISILGIPLAEPQQVSAAGTSDPKYLSSITMTATASSKWDTMHDTELFKDLSDDTFYSSHYKTADTALQISNEKQLAAFAKAVNEKKRDFDGKYVELTAENKVINLDGKNPTIQKSTSGNKFSIDITGSAGNVWTPIGTSDNPFKGTFDGNECEIRNMTVLVNSTSGNVYAGLFGRIEGASINDTRVTGNVYVSSSASSSASVYAGGLVGTSSGGSISDSYVMGNVYSSSSSDSSSSYSRSCAGGLAGQSYKGIGISNSYATGDVYSFSSSLYYTFVKAGGLVGEIYSNMGVSNSYATGNVYSSSYSDSSFRVCVYAGGLVGSSSSTMSNSYSTGDVYAYSYSSSPDSDSFIDAGGLVGEIYNGGIIKNSYATGNVYVSYSSTSDAHAGGLVGFIENGGSIIDSYSTGNISASTSASVYAGGLVGLNDSGGITNSYATGNVSASTSASVYAGRLVGQSDSGSITNSYYYSGSTFDVKRGATISSDGEPLTMDQITGTGSDRATERMSSLSTNDWTFQADGIGIKYLPRLNNITYNEETNPVPRFLASTDLTASYFDFEAPSDPPIVYDGQIKKAKVTPKISGIPDDKITIKYYDDSGKELSGPPTNAGTYIVKINVAQGDGFNKKDGITDKDWTFTVEKATPKADDFIYSQPDNLVYDGKEKIAQVIAKDSVKGQVGAIKGVYYYYKNEDGELIPLDGPPRDVGNYVAYISVEGGDNYKECEVHNDDKWTFSIGKDTPEAGDFDFAPPGDTTYNGQAKEATVTAKSEINGMGEIIAIKYYKDGEEVTPTNVGEYTVEIDVAQGDNYNAATLGGTNWKFTITKDSAKDPGTPKLEAITYSKDFTLGKIELGNGWKWKDSSIIPTVKNEGYVAYYEVEDYDNYDWLNIVGYNPELHRIERTLDLTVNPAEPTIPSGLVGIFGQTLKDVTIPQIEEEGTWSWNNKDTKLSEIGDHSYQATFTPAENGNYSTKSTDGSTDGSKELKVTVERKPIDSEGITISDVKDEYEYDGNDSSIQPEITVKYDGQKLEEGKDYTVSYDSVSWKEVGGTIDGGVTITGIGNYTGSVYKGFRIKDKVLPKGKIKLGDNIEFSLFNSKVGFKYMFKEPKTVEIEGSDSQTGIKNIYYYISDEDLFTSKSEYTNDDIENIISSKDWNVYDKDKEIKLSMGTKNIIYAKIVDNSDNVKYMNSSGIVIYTDSTVDEKEIVYVKNTESDAELKVSTNGNTVKNIEVKDEGDVKHKVKYKVSEEDANKSRTITFPWGDLNKLPAGNYKITVTYNPQGAEYTSESSGDAPEQSTIDLTIKRAKLLPDYFNFTPPEDPIYNGEEKVATVTATSDEIGEITDIKYYDISDPDASERELSGAPIIPGTYKVKISVDQSDKYDSAETIDGGWTFKVEYLKLGDNSYKITISENDYKKDNSNYWLKDNNMATISPTGKDYKISTEPGKGYTYELEVSSWTPGTAIYLKDDDDHMTNAIKVNVNISQDKNSPTGSITIKDRTPWESLINVITFGLFFKEEQKATITASDGESGIQEAKYLVSNIDLIQNENEQSKEIKTKLDSQKGWESLKNNSQDVTLEKDNKYVVYEKITDNVGHVTYISSDGIVIYTDSEVEKSEIEYVKETKEDLKLKIFTKGNTIKDIEVKDEGDVKHKVKYKVSEEDANKSRTITFSWGDLNELPAVNYKITVTYNPQGVEYNGTGDAPTDSTVNLKVVKNPTVTIDKFDFTPPGDPIYNGEAKEATVTAKKGVNGVGKIKINYYDSTGALLEGYPTNVGEYIVKIDVEEGTSYGKVEGLTSENWKFTIKPDFPKDPVTPTPKAVKYGTKLSEITLDDGWNWVDDTITATVENQGYVAYYDVEDDTNYDWSNIEGYNAELHRVERTLKLTVFVDKSDWGEEVRNNDEINYVDDDGTTSSEVVEKDVTWVKEESDGTDAWYGVDNSEGQFELGSRFWVRWLNKEKDKEEWEYYYNNLDEKHKNAVDSDRLWIFLAGVTAPNGQEYKEFNKEVKFYIQLGEDWDKEDINSVFISSGEDEIVDVSYADSMSCPEGKKEFAILTLKHFSPYAVYDKLTDEERAALMESENKDRNETNSDEDSDNVMYRVWSLFTTGDTATPLVLTGLAVLVIASGITMIILKKKRKK